MHKKIALWVLLTAVQLLYGIVMTVLRHAELATIAFSFVAGCFIMLIASILDEQSSRDKNERNLSMEYSMFLAAWHRINNTLESFELKFKATQEYSGKLEIYDAIDKYSESCIKVLNLVKSVESNEKYIKIRDTLSKSMVECNALYQLQHYYKEGIGSRKEIELKIDRIANARYKLYVHKADGSSTYIPGVVFNILEDKSDKDTKQLSKLTKAGIREIFMRRLIDSCNYITEMEYHETEADRNDKQYWTSLIVKHLTKIKIYEEIVLAMTSAKITSVAELLHISGHDNRKYTEAKEKFQEYLYLIE